MWNSWLTLFFILYFDYIRTLPLVSKASGEKSAHDLDDLLYVMGCSFLCLAAFKILWLVFKSSVIIRLGVDLFEFILLEFFELHVCSIKYGMFTTIISGILSVPFSHSFPSGTPTKSMLVHLMVSHKSLKFCFPFLHSSFFLFLKLNNYYCSYLHLC